MGGAATAAPVKHGLALRFEVQIDEHDLGAWSKCEGLEVDFKPKVYAALGNNAYAHQLPGPATYANLKLTRACSDKSSAAVVGWLRSMLAQPRRPGSASVTLYDGWGEPVMSWKLLHVLPVSWKGPALDADTSKVALEVLELAHNGFESLAEAGPPKRVTLGTPTVTITFPLNPCKLSVSRSSQWDAKGSHGGTQGTPSTDHKGGGGSTTKQTGGSQKKVQSGHTGPRHKGNKAATLKMSVTLDDSLGEGNTCANLKQLQEWTCPPKEMEGTTSPHPPSLVLAWGSRLHFVGFLQMLTVTYSMVAPDGTPIRADVEITLLEAPPVDKATNPSSGGLPGRRAHLVTDGDTLQSVAQREYGDPSRWRALAAVNGIDDPLRLPPGTSLLLLAESELGGLR